MRIRALCLSHLCLGIIVGATHPLLSQLAFSPGSRLADSAYVAGKIRTVSDQDLFESLDLSIKGLSRVREAWRTGNSRQAYTAWGAYWNGKTQPRYLTQSYKLLNDTELLTGYEDYRQYIARNPDDRDSILSRANNILRNVIRTWGDSVIDFGPTVDFNREIGQSGKYGFHYWGWGHPLISASVLTGEKKYGEKFEELFNRWFEQRNYITRGFRELDVVFYELGLGARNRVFVEYYLLPEASRSVQTHERMLKNFLSAGRWLYELEKWEGYRSGNWQIVGASTLVQIALTFPELKESAEWLQVGLQRLDEHLRKDFFADGGHSERAPRNYTLLTYLSYRNMHYLLTRHGKEIPMLQAIHQTMGKTVDWWLAMMTPTGEVPALNDSHRGLFPVEVIRDGAQMFGKPDVYGVLRNLLNESVDPEGSLPPFLSRHMPASGFTVMRSDWTRQARYLSITYGPSAGFHTHADLLGIEIYAYGRALAVDAGLGLTYDDPLYRNWYQSTRAHNTLVVNGLNMNREKAVGEKVKWVSIPSLEYVSAEHHGYDSLGVTHCRTIVFVDREYWFVLDDVTTGAGPDTLSWYLHSPTRLQTYQRGFRSATAPGLLILPADEGFSFTKGHGMAASTSDLTPGKVEEINWIRLNRIAADRESAQFPVLLYPYPEVPPPVFVERESGSRFRVGRSTTSDVLWFSGGHGDEDGFETDALFVRIHSGGAVREATVLDGTFLKYHGRTLWRSGQMTSETGIAITGQ